MALTVFNVSLFLLGVLGSFWTTLSALVEYCFDRIEELDRRIPEVIFKEILPSYAKPIVHQNLRTCSFPEVGTPLESGCVLPRRKNIPRHKIHQLLQCCFIFSVDEVEGLLRQSALALEQDCPWWLPKKHMHCTINDLIGQYIWYNGHTPLEDFESE